MAYLLDANVFIEAKNRQYGLDFCPAFWDWLVRENTAGRVFSIEKVEDEVLAAEDDLADWADARGSAFFLPLTPAVVPALTTVSEWAQGQGYQPTAVSTFLSVADYYLVAHALAEGHVVVTNETPSTSLKKIKIPDACIGIGVQFSTPFAMLRAERARFVLAPAP